MQLKLFLLDGDQFTFIYLFFSNKIVKYSWIVNNDHIVEMSHIYRRPTIFFSTNWAYSLVVRVSDQFKYFGI